MKLRLYSRDKTRICYNDLMDRVDRETRNRNDQFMVHSLG